MYNGKELNNIKQIATIKKVMQIEGVSFAKAIEIIDKLNEANLLDCYIDSHKEYFN